jgi:hypothetical protein
MRRQLSKPRGKIDMRTNYIVRLLLFALLLLAASATSFAQVSIGISVGFAPPPLPVYEQPLCPAEGYLWTPGYWAWDDEDGDYYWVPGTWVRAPEVGYLWTPSYWGWGGNAFIFHEGYWGPQIGFYGGINYGYGYFGHGYEGGRWDRDRFYYNRTVNNINVTEIHNTYNTTIVNNNTTINRVSYNGGNGGINARPTNQEEVATRERHLPPVAPQVQHVQAARSNRDLRASVNQGKPPIAATPKPGAFNERGIVPARQAGGHYEPPPANRSANNPRGTSVGARDNRVTSGGNNAGTGNANRLPIHPSELPPHQRPTSPNTGNPKVDQKYQQQQEKMYAKQEQDRQRLQQKQEQDHQRLLQQRADDGRKQQVEQRHQQQTQQLQQHHEQQQQHLQQRQPPPPPPPHESRPPGRPPL